MKKLNLHSTRLFLKLIEQLGNRWEMILNIPGFYPFTMRRLDPVSTTYGEGLLYLLKQTYTRKETGNRIYRYPEMTFIVVDRRTQSGPSARRVHIFPQRFVQDAHNLNQVSVIIEDGAVKHFWPDHQGDQCTFANDWFKNLKEEGFIK